jgi:hypothetical protein
MAPDGSPLAIVAQQGAEAANLVIMEKSVGVLWRELSVGDNDRAKHARSEVVSLASPNRRLSDHDAWRRITQNCTVQEYGRERDNLCNVIKDQRHLRLRTPSHRDGL